MLHKFVKNFPRPVFNQSGTRAPTETDALESNTGWSEQHKKYII